MARGQKQASQSPNPGVFDDEVAVSDQPQLASADLGMVTGPVAAPKKAPKVSVKQWQVRDERTIMYNGARTTMKAGKVIDERFYNLRVLQQQGVTLVPLEAIEL